MAQQGILSWFTDLSTRAGFNGGQSKKSITKNLSGYISPVQLQRLRYDIQMWRDAVAQAENAWYPQRVDMQRMYIDTILSGHTLACVNRRKDLTLMRDWSFKNKEGVENEELKELLNKPWFAYVIECILDARAFGYNLVALGAITNNEFKDIEFIRRWNVSPDRLNVTQYIYSLSGEQFLSEPFVDWHLWIPTKSDTGQSKVGYGYLYSVAQYEILGRNLMGNNADAAELYGMPARVVKTDKTEGAERDKLFDAVQNMGSNPAIMTDLTDIVELLESSGNGQGFKIYGELEKRLEAKISKLILGHADALDSTPGKLGSQDDPAQEAMLNKMLADGAFVEDIINGTLIPKLIKLGFIIDTDYKFTFSNNIEVEKARSKRDAQNLQTATVAYTMKQAGLQYDAAQFAEETGIETTEAVIAPPKLDKNITAKMKEFFKY